MSDYFIYQVPLLETFCLRGCQSFPVPLANLLYLCPLHALVRQLKEIFEISRHAGEL